MGTPPTAATLATLARTHWRHGELQAAAEQAGRSLAMQPGFVPALVVSGLCAQARGDAGASRTAFSELKLPDADPRVVEFVFQALVENVRDGRRLFAAPPVERSAVPPLTLTVVTCSVDAGRLARLRESLRRSLAPGYESIELLAPRSLAQAYNDALAAARGEAIVFVHDDVEILTPQLDRALARALARADVVGIAGTRTLAGPTLGWAGQAALSGWLVHGSSAASTWGFSLLALRGGLVGGMQGLDGCFLAARTSAARRIGFDAATFDGFHFYDLDFCLRAHRAGLRLAVDTDILLAHASRGRLGFAWESQARRFVTKFAPIGSTPARPNHFHATALASAAEALDLHAEVNGFCASIGSRAD
jgi:hypothetical protein